MEVLDGVLIDPFEMIFGEALPIIPPTVADPEGTVTPVWTHPAISGTVLDGELTAVEGILTGDPDYGIDGGIDGDLITETDAIQGGDPDFEIDPGLDGCVLEDLYMKPDSETGILRPISDALKSIHLTIQYTSKYGSKSPWSVPVPYKVEKELIEPI